jgi:methionyl-tRNA formyltransferase
MRLVFAGTPEFAAVALSAAHGAGHDIVLVLTQPDRPAGRGMKLQPSSVKQWALAHNLRVVQPPSLRGEAADVLREVGPIDAMVVVAYGLLLPPEVLALPRLGCLNVHASLLPRWRGAAPIQRAVLAGDAATGVAVMQMEAGLDTGPVWAERETPIGARETAGELHDRLAALGADLLVEVLDRLDRGIGAGAPVAQPAEGVTYAHKIGKAEALLDFCGSAVDLDRRVRAFNPAPGASSEFRGERLKVWRVEPDAAAEPGADPGTVLASDPERGVRVACGHGSLWLQEVQRAGARRQPAEGLVRSGWLRAGDRLASAPHA